MQPAGLRLPSPGLESCQAQSRPRLRLSCSLDMQPLVLIKTFDLKLSVMSSLVKRHVKICRESCRNHLTVIARPVKGYIELSQELWNYQ